MSLTVLVESGYAQDQNKLDSIYGGLDWNTEPKLLLSDLLNEVVKLRETNDLPSAKVVLDTVFKLAETFEGVDYQIARGYIDAAIIARMESNEDLMVSHYQEAITIYQMLQETAHDTMQPILVKNISICYNNSAQAFLGKEQYELALEFYHNSINTVKPMNDSLRMSIGYYNVSQTYGYMNMQDSAFKYIMLSKELEEAMKSDEGLAYAHEGLARVYNNKQEFVLALTHLDSAQSYLEKIGDEFFMLDLVDLKADILIEIDGLQEAIEILEISLIKSRQIGYRSFEIGAVEKLSQLYADAENYAKAYSYLLEVRRFDAEANAEETQKKIEEFQVQYETSQKDKEIQQLALQNELKEKANKSLLEKKAAEDSRNKVVNWSLVGGIGLLLLIGGLLYNDSLRRRRINKFLKTNNENLSLKNEKILHQSKLIGDSISYAQNIQRAILPSKLEVDKHISDHFVFFKPKDIVSGDFYWMYAVPETRKVLFAVADCTGHGVPGAFMSIVGHALLEKITKQLNIHQPGAVLTQLAVELRNTLKKRKDAVVDDGMDIALVAIDYDKEEITFAGARNPLIFVQDSEMTHYKGDRVDLGKQIDVVFSEEKIAFNKGNKVYLFTDGFQDQKGGEANKKYFPANFRAFLLSSSSLTMSEQEELLKSEFNQWKGEQEQMDDVLVVGLEL